jgi:pilus assembly protein CpaE
MNAYLVGSLDRQVEELLHACGVRTTVTSGEELAALANPSTQQPDVVVLDLRSRASMVPAAVALLKRQHPLTGVLIVASHLDPSLMLEAMRAGVNEFVTEPVTAKELKAAIDRVVSKQPMRPTGQIFAFVGGKGGVGTTTLAVNVATVLATMEPSSALLIDLHVAYGDAAMFLGIEPRFSVADALENVHRIDETFLRGVVGHTKIGLDVLAASDRSVIGHIDAPAVRSVIDCAARQYSYVVLDVPRSDTTMLEALDQATRGSSSSPTRSWRRSAARAGWLQRSASDTAKSAWGWSSAATTSRPRSAGKTSSASSVVRSPTCFQATTAWRWMR